jgi:hypothetical protein
MSSSSKSKILLTNLDWNIQHFEQILNNDKTDYYRDAAIQRFCLVFDAAKKSLSALAKEKGKTINSVDDCFQIAKEEQWTNENYNSVISDYGLVKDGFKPDLAETVYPRLSYHYSFFQKLYNTLSKGV